MERQACTLGVDIGGTKVAVVVCDERGHVILEDRTPTAVSGGVDPGLAISLELARDVRDRATAKGLDITGIGVGMPEYVDRNGLVTSHEVVDWVTQPTTLFEQLGPTWVESDVRCGALAEATIGAGRELSCFMYVTVGTGLSSSLVIDGKPWSGHRGEAIAIGELPVEGLGSADGTNLEAYASGAGMAARYATHNGAAPASRVIDLATKGDTIAQEIVRSSANALGRALAAMASIVDPEAFVLGGGLGTSGGEWHSYLVEAYQLALHPRPNPPHLLLAKLMEDSGAVGAALLPHTDKKDVAN